MTLGCAPDPIVPHGDAGSSSIDAPLSLDAGEIIDTSLPLDASPSADTSAPNDTGSVPAPVDAAVVTPTDVPAPTARDFGRPGPHAVSVWMGAVPGTPSPARVFHPMTAGADRFPLVVFAHGFQLGVANYDSTLRHVASYGYVVASVDFPGGLLMVDHRQVAAAMGAAREAFVEGRVAGFPLSGRIDPQRTAAMGHSLGGKAAVMTLLDVPAWVTALAIDPVDDNPGPGGSPSPSTPSIAPERIGALQRPLGLFGATQSRCGNFGIACAPTASDYSAFLTGAPRTATLGLWVLQNFGHMDMVEGNCGIPCLTCARGAMPTSPRLDALRAISVAWLERHLRGDTAAQSWINGPVRAAYVTAGVLWNGASDTLPPCR